MPSHWGVTMLGTAATPRRLRARTGTLALVAVLGLLAAGTPSRARAAPGEPVTTPLATEGAAADDNRDSGEPFGRPTSEVSVSPLIGKWQTVKQSIDAELSLLTLCRLDLAFCPSPAAIEFLSIVERARQREGLAKVGEINRAINLDIRPAADIELYQVEDFWTSPLVTLTAGAGDCEDYAIAKFVALREAGVPSRDLRLVILRDDRLHADHAVVAVRVDHHWRILDSRRLLMLEDSQFIRFQAMSHFEPIFSIGDAGIQRYDDNAVVAATATAVAPVF